MNFINGIFDTGPNSVIFWQTICWVLWGFLVFILPLAGKYILSKRDDEILLIQINKKFEVLEDIEQYLKDNLQYLAILKDRDGHRARIQLEEGSREAPDDMYVRIGGKSIKVKDLETLLNITDTQQKPIDKY